jgi:hypothetical protein
MNTGNIMVYPVSVTGKLESTIPETLSVIEVVDEFPSFSAESFTTETLVSSVNERLRLEFSCRLLTTNLFDIEKHFGFPKSYHPTK